MNLHHMFSVRHVVVNVRQDIGNVRHDVVSVRQNLINVRHDVVSVRHDVASVTKHLPRVEGVLSVPVQEARLPHTGVAQCEELYKIVVIHLTSLLTLRTSAAELMVSLYQMYVVYASIPYKYLQLISSSGD